MRACKRGNVATRNRHGHCMCSDCVAFRNKRSRETKTPGYNREWARRNPEKVIAYSKKWIAENKQKRRDIERSWRKRNPEKVAAMNAKGGAKWTALNRGKRNAITAARRAALRKRIPAWADREKIKEIYMLAHELTVLTGTKHEVDHIYPLRGDKVSGLHVAENLQILTMSENRSKGANICAA